MPPTRATPSASAAPDIPDDGPGSTDQRILAVARRQLFTQGYNALTMDELAHDLGMSKKTLYRHFPGKDAIVSTVIDEMGSVVRREMEEVLREPRQSFAQKLRAVIEVVARRLAQTSPVMWRELRRYAPKIHRKLDELRQKNIPSVFGRLFRTGIAEGALRPGLDPDFAAQFWLQAIRGLLHPDTLAVTRLTPRQSLEKALELFTGGLLTPAGRKDYEKIFSL